MLKLYIAKAVRYSRAVFRRLYDVNSCLVKDLQKTLKKTNNSVLVIILISLSIVLLLIGGSAYLQHKIYTPFSRNNSPQIFIVSPGETVRQIALNLEKQRLIGNDFYFLVYFKELQVALGRKITLKAGQYQLSPHMAIPQILEKLRHGLVIPEEIKLTIPEGYNIFQIAKLLKEKGLIKDEATFLNFSAKYTWDLQRNDFMLIPCSKPRVGSVPQVPCNSVFPLEGYLFPDTYRFRRGEPIKAIIRKMIQNFERKVTELTQKENHGTDTEVPCRLSERVSCNSVLIMASLLEKEVSSYYDKRVVAGILYKRLKAGMPLQVDSSILYAKMLALNNADSRRGIYAEKQNHNPVSVRDTKIDSLYNTYKHKGLPPGPICNPGLQSIKAALNPIKTDYWYYLNAKDGKTVFSRTYEEHLMNKEKYLK